MNEGFINISLVYASEYSKNGKNFVTCFIKYKSIRLVCEAIVATYKSTGAFQEITGKDFTGWANKQPVDDKWKRVLSEMMLIIWGITIVK